MECLKFNCFDLADRGAACQKSAKQMYAIMDELSAVIRGMPLRVKNRLDIARRMLDAHAAVSDIAERLRASAEALNALVDVYYAAESAAKDKAQELPVGTAAQAVGASSRVSGPIESISPATIRSQDVCVETWLLPMLDHNP